jgi:hypothetical protein
MEITTETITTTTTSTTITTPFPTSSLEGKKKNSKTSSNLYFGKVILPKTLGKVSSAQHLENLNNFLEDEKLSNQQDSWSKLDKTMKLKKLKEYAEIYSSENELTKDETNLLESFLKDSLEKKKLYRVKDVAYSKDTGTIKCIHGLIFHKQNQRFSLKVHDTVITRKSKPATHQQSEIKSSECVEPI